MKAKKIQNMICLGIILWFACQAWAEDWSYFDTAPSGDMYYDKSGIEEVSKNIIAVRTKNVLNEDAKRKYFSILKDINKAPESPSRLSYYISSMELNYTSRKVRDVSVIFCDEKGNIVYASPKSESGEWNPIEPRSVGEKLYNLVSWEPVISRKAVAVSGMEKTLAPKKEVATLPHAADKNATSVARNPEKDKTVSKEEVAGLRPGGINHRESNATEIRREPANHKPEDRKIKPVMEGRSALVIAVRETGRDGRFIAFDDQTVLDTQTNLMWAARDNGRDINWYGAKKYCEKYRGGGYKDWRMPTQDELAQLYDTGKSQRDETAQNSLHLTKLIDLTSCCPWSSDARGFEAAYFDFSDGSRWWFLTPGSLINRAIPVRSSK